MAQIYYGYDGASQGYGSRGGRGRRRRRRRMQQLFLYLIILAIVLGVLLGIVIWKQAGITSPKKPVPGNDGIAHTGTEAEGTEDEPGNGNNPVIPAMPSGPRFVVAVDAGHGGKDQGASTDDGKVIEKDICLRLAYLLKAELEENDIGVLMIRDDDTFLKLSRRAKLANDAGVDLYISLHVDKYPEDSKVYGMTCHYQKGAADGKVFAETIAKNLKKEQDWKIRNNKDSDLSVLRNTQMPAMLFEAGFISNSNDLDNLNNSEFCQKLVQRLREGIEEYYNSNLAKEPNP